MCPIINAGSFPIAPLLHGYSLQFKFTFGCDKLDNKNWAVDFGGLKPLKKWLEDLDSQTALI